MELIDYYGGEKKTQIRLDRTRYVVINGHEVLMNSFGCSDCEVTYYFDDSVIHNFCPFCGVKYSFKTDISI